MTQPLEIPCQPPPTLRVAAWQHDAVPLVDCEGNVVARIPAAELAEFERQIHERRAERD